MTYLRRLIAVTFTLLFAVARANAQTSNISGTVTDALGKPLTAATVSIHPARAHAVHTDANGRFDIENVPAGAYVVSVSKGGYISSSIESVDPRTAAPLTFSLNSATLNTLEQISTVRASAASTFNTSSSAVVNVSQQQFTDQGQVQIGHVLDEIPGVVSARPGTGNAAVPGSITSPNLRGALDYEKATLLDGHPLINGARGDYPTMLVDSLLFDSVEVVKGPTAYAPEINYGIGGTLNFRTGDPTPYQTGSLTLGADNFGGTFGSLRLSDTIGKLGYYLDFADDGTEGPLQSAPTYITPGVGWKINGKTVASPVTSTNPINGAAGSPFPIPNAVGNPTAGYTSLVACCQSVTSTFLNRGEVAKLQYHFSQATTFTAGYVGIQSIYDGPASSLTQVLSTFAPGSGYSGAGAPIPALSQFTLNTTPTLSNQNTYDNEPMFEGELRTTLGTDTILARFYSAVLERATYSDSTSPSASYTTNLNLYGTAVLGAPGSAPMTFNGPATVTVPASSAYLNSMSDHDYLRGESFQYDHPAGADLFTFAYDRNTSLTNSYKINPGSGTTTESIPGGTRQNFSTYLLRGVFQFGDKTQLTLANYYNVYQNTFAPASSNGVFTFSSNTTTHDDPRLGLSYLPNPNVAVRFSAGSAIAPPFPQLLDNLNTTPATTPPANGVIMISQNSGSLLPETSFGYDLGSDMRLRTGDIVSIDTYLTNIRNQFVGVVYADGTYNGTPVYVTTNENLAQSRYDGVEVSFRHDPVRGYGYTISGSLDRAYAYAVSPSFYTSANGPYTTNLGVVPGINYIGFANGWNGISNKSEAYSMGYAQVHHRGSAGQYSEFGLTYYGPNNTFNDGAFFVASAAYRQPLGRGTALQFSVDNLFNADSLKYISYGAAVPAPLVNGQLGVRNLIPYGPATLRLILTKSFGGPNG